MTKLSVIIPCFNCADTLEQAVTSVYSQESPPEFELILVDDGSTDTTPVIIERLARRHPNTRVMRHPANRGGGAARNTGASASDGDVLFFLDSDDILDTSFLKNMAAFWSSKRCDGVAISTSVKFRGNDRADVAFVDEFAADERPIPLLALFQNWRACPLYSTFLITRQAFAKIGGYPVQHGFDTQGMAFRFLCEGLQAFVAPDTIYYHRVEHGASYYLREMWAGRTNWNWLQVFDEHLYIFSDRIKAALLDCDPAPPDGEFYSSHVRKIVEPTDDLFAENVDELIRLGRRGVAERLTASNNKYDQYWLGGYHLAAGNPKAALSSFTRALEAGFDHRMIHLKILEASLLLSGHTESAAAKLNQLLAYTEHRAFPASDRVKTGLRRLLRSVAVGLRIHRPSRGQSRRG